MAARPKTWPQAAEELLPNTLFRLADQHPDATYAEYFTNPTDLAHGYHKVTFRRFANAVHATAWWIEQHVGKPNVGDGSEAMVYFGPNDLRYGILVFASIIVGYKVRSMLARTQWDKLTYPTRCYFPHHATVLKQLPN
jgi:hypothetical protein